MRLLLWRIFSLYNGLLYLEAQLILQYDIEGGRFGAAVLARPVWRRRFGAGRFGALPFWRRTFWRKYIQISTQYLEAGMMRRFLPN